MTQEYENLTNEEYAQVKKLEYRRKKLREQSRKNAKSQQGFGYEYKPLQFNFNENK